MYSTELLRDAEWLLAEFRTRKLLLATAESCTGGLIIGLLTEIPGSSDVVDRGFVTYSNAAKTEMLGVPAELIRTVGAVSTETARAMASGAIDRSRADVSVSVTGVAGPGGGSPEKPVGLVHIAAARRGQPVLHEECRFGDIGRSAIREATIRAALILVRKAARIK